MSSTPNEPAEVVAAGYDAVADRYARLEGEEEWPRMRWLRALLTRLPEGADVLDLGCGSAVPAGPEIARKHRLTGVDVSARQIALARRNVPGATFVQADMAELSFADESFDAVVSFYAIGHVPREIHRDLFERVRRWLRPGGLLLLSEEDADRPGLVGDWLGAPMFFSGFDAATLTRLVLDAGFEILEHAIERQREQGVDVPFAWVLARRRG